MRYARRLWRHYRCRILGHQPFEAEDAWGSPQYAKTYMYSSRRPTKPPNLTTIRCRRFGCFGILGYREKAA